MSEYKFINPYNFIPLGDKCHKTTYQKEIIQDILNVF